MKKNKGNGVGIVAIVIFLFCVIIGMIQKNTLVWSAIGLGTDFAVFFFVHMVSIKKLKASGVFVNVFVTDCERVKQSTQNGEEEYYILSCEADDTKVFGTAKVCSPKYVPIGARTVLFYNPKEQVLCLASILDSEMDPVTFFASLLFFAGAVVAYLVGKYENVLITTDEICRMVMIGASFCFIVLGFVFFWVNGKQNKQSVENHRYSAELVRYVYQHNGQGPFAEKHPVWRYYYKGRYIEYESRTEKRFWHKIGSKSEVYVPENDLVFEKSETWITFLYGVIFLGFGIVMAVLSILWNSL